MINLNRLSGKKMKRIKENLSEQGILFSDHYVGDRLSSDDEVYLYKELIDNLDISTITNSYGKEGGSMYAPKDKLSVILYAFFKGITSSVKMAELVQKHLQFIYLAGGHLIKRRTISDFRLKHIVEIHEIFESSVNLAIDSGLVRYEDIFALDGSKFSANASRSKTRSKNDWEERQKKIVCYVEEFLKKWEEQDKLEEDIEEENSARFEKIKENLKNIKKQTPPEKAIDTYKSENIENNAEKVDTNKDKKKELNSQASKAASIKNRIKINDLEDADQFLKEHEKIDSLLNEYKSAKNDMLLNLTDSDCRVMKNDKATRESYNVQIISNNQVIVAEDVTQDENDQNQLKPMLENLKNNLELNKKDEKILFDADAGYNKGENLKYLDNEDKIDSYISMYNRSEKNNPAKNKFHKENFSYDEDDDSFTCPHGEKIDFVKEFISDNKKCTLYGCQLRKCIDCIDKKNCITTKADIRRGYRTIEDDSFIVYRKEMREKMQKEDSKNIYAKRAAIVEPVFGQIKSNRMSRRFRLNSLLKVKGEFAFMAIAHNLGKIMKYKLKNSNIMQNAYNI